MSNRHISNMRIVFYSHNHGRMLEFEYDEAKSRSNEAKHGLGFEEAQELWADEHLVTMRVERKGEKRSMAIARYAGSYWSAIYVDRNAKVRLISVRRSTKVERRLYDKAYQSKWHS